MDKNKYKNGVTVINLDKLLKEKKKRHKLGDISVIAGTNEVAIVIKVSGKGYLSQRLKEGTMGEVDIVGRLNKKQAKLYWTKDRIEEIFGDKKKEKNGRE